MKINPAMFGGASPLPLGPSGTAPGVLATCVPAKAKNRKRKVPTNSPRAATVLLRRVAGRVLLVVLVMLVNAGSFKLGMDGSIFSKALVSRRDWLGTLNGRQGERRKGGRGSCLVG